MLWTYKGPNVLRRDTMNLLSLPAEILEIIGRFLTDDVTDMLCAATTCTTLRAAVEKHARHITIREHPRHVQSIAVFKRIVEDLHVNGPCVCFVPPRALARSSPTPVVAQMSRLKFLTMTNSRPFDIRWQTVFENAPELTTIHMHFEYCQTHREATMTSLIDMVTLQSSVESVTLSCDDTDPGSWHFKNRAPLLPAGTDRFRGRAFPPRLQTVLLKENSAFLSILYILMHRNPRPSLGLFV